MQKDVFSRRALVFQKLGRAEFRSKTFTRALEEFWLHVLPYTQRWGTA